MHTATAKLKLQTNTNRYSEIIQHLSNQMILLNEAYSTYTNQQSSLEQSSNKQTEALNMALDIILKKHNTQ
ncbi:unnamed protein product [Rotaria sp. Silwood2]|nr:unnamed protein product [Rotaria sp. Silwood2]